MLIFTLYYYQTNKFARVISRLLSTQIWSSSMNLHKYHVRKFTTVILIFIRPFLKLSRYRFNPKH